ncbi:MAG: hypothetical protein P8N50_00280 [Actinomycetota bacterium]|nr:hypothetical protein [Actinomycetota bacterium]
METRTTLAEFSARNRIATVLCADPVTDLNEALDAVHDALQFAHTTSGGGVKWSSVLYGSLGLARREIDDGVIESIATLQSQTLLPVALGQLVGELDQTTEEIRRRVGAEEIERRQEVSQAWTTIEAVRALLDSRSAALDTAAG